MTFYMNIFWYRKKLKMYANKILETLDMTNSVLMTPEFAANIDDAKSDIKKAQKFHFFNYTNCLDVVKNIFTHEENRNLSFGACPDYIKLPYKICWFDYYYDKLLAPNDNTPPAKKRGMLVYESPIKKIYCVTLFYEQYNKWIMRDVRYLLPAGASFADVTTASEFAKISEKNCPIRYIINVMNQWTFPLDLTGKTTKERLNICIKEDYPDLVAFNAFCLLLNAKNILFEPIDAPEKLNKKRSKNGKLPIYSYKILKVDLKIFQKNNNNHKGETVGSNRVHLCRGHFKFYTKDAPLFGKYTGLYWWEPHIRGQNKKGMITKDYVVE